jgi:hypothetical protein
MNNAEEMAATHLNEGGEGSASDEPHPTEENRRADEGGHQ